MGVVNVTPTVLRRRPLPLHPDAAIAHGLQLVEEGAAVIDVGGVDRPSPSPSTPPRSNAVPFGHQRAGPPRPRSATRATPVRRRPPSRRAPATFINERIGVARVRGCRRRAGCIVMHAGDPATTRSIRSTTTSCPTSSASSSSAPSKPSSTSNEYSKAILFLFGRGVQRHCRPHRCHSSRNSAGQAGHRREPCRRGRNHRGRDGRERTEGRAHAAARFQHDLDPAGHADAALRHGEIVCPGRDAGVGPQCHHGPSVTAGKLGARQLIALAKASPGKLQYASAGIGTFPHLGGELFKLMADIDILHVPFKGSAPALIDVVGGHTQLTFATIPSSLTHIRSGKLKALGIGGTQRNGLLPDVPTVAKSGLPGYAAANWNGIVAPAGTPSAIIERLHREILKFRIRPTCASSSRSKAPISCG